MDSLEEWYQNPEHSLDSPQSNLYVWFTRFTESVREAAKKVFFFGGQSTKAFILSGQKNGYKFKKTVKKFFFP